MQNTFLDYFSLFMSLYEMFCADPLHQNEHGVWGKHLWPWFKAHYLSKGEPDELDERSVYLFVKQLRTHK